MKSKKLQNCLSRILISPKQLHQFILSPSMWPNSLNNNNNNNNNHSDNIIKIFLLNLIKEASNIKCGKFRTQCSKFDRTFYLMTTLYIWECGMRISSLIGMIHWLPPLYLTVRHKSSYQIYKYQIYLADNHLWSNQNHINFIVIESFPKIYLLWN